jgi:hypothetical protein
MVQAFALSKLVLPWFLSHEHNAIQHVAGWTDGRNLLTLSVWTALLAAAWHITRQLAASVDDEAVDGGDASAPGGLVAAQRDGGAPRKVWLREHACRLLVGFSMALVAYFPSSHLTQYVAFVLAERTLYLPSLGAALVLAEALVALAEWPALGGLCRPASGCDVHLAAASALAMQDVGGAPADATSGDMHQPSKGGSNAAAGTTPRGTARTGRAARRSLPPSRTRRVVESESSPGYDDAPPVDAGTSTAAHMSETGAANPLPAHSRGASAALAAAIALAAVWSYRTVTRNRDWLTEDALMASNLALYPTGNTMTIYGMGCVHGRGGGV